MIKRTSVAGYCVLLALALQTQSKAYPRVGFVVPQGADPITKLFFSSNGQQLSFFGVNLLPGSGVEFHQAPSSNFVVNRLVFAPKNTNFRTQFTVDSFGGNGTCMPLSTPWQGPNGQTAFNFQLFAQTGSVRIGDIVFDSCAQTRGPAYAAMILTNGDGLQQSFDDQEFFVTAFGTESVPEGSGFWMLLAGMPVLGILARRRQQRMALIRVRK